MKKNGFLKAQEHCTCIAEPLPTLAVSLIVVFQAEKGTKRASLTLSKLARRVKRRRSSLKQQHHNLEGLREYNISHPVIHPLLFTSLFTRFRSLPYSLFCSLPYSPFLFTSLLTLPFFVIFSLSSLLSRFPLLARSLFLDHPRALFASYIPIQSCTTHTSRVSMLLT